METDVQFRCDRFPPYEREEEEINPGIYGKRVAEFLVEGLHAKSFKTGEPIAEDWGWLIPVENDSFNLRIGCANYPEYQDGFLCFIEPHHPTIRKFFRRIDTTARVGALRDAMDQILSVDAGIRDKRWWTYEQFNHVQGEH